MKSLEKLTKDIENIEATRNSKLFHKVISDILIDMGFARNYDSYGITIKTWSYDDKGKVILKENAISGFDLERLNFFNFFIENSKFPIDYFTRTENFTQGDLFFDIVTFYRTFLHLKEGIYNSKFITSNSKLSSSQKVIDFYDLKRNHPLTDEEKLLDLILENNGILKKGNRYFFSPKSILDLISSEPRIIYANFIKKDN